MLLEHSAHTEQLDDFQGSALIIASFNNNCESNVKVFNLLECGTQVEHLDKADNSALMYASMLGHDKVAKLLLEHGAQVDIQNNDGMSPLLEATCIKRTR